MTIQRALISVSDKRNLHKLAPFLEASGVEIISTGGTLKYLKQHGVKAQDISSFTGFPEMMNGRLKTLHPKVHGGILGRRVEDRDVMWEHEIKPIDLVVVNLYDFESAIAKPGTDLAYAIENIDIGGPAMLRSAAKNYIDVVPLVDPDDYDHFMAAFAATNEVSLKDRMKYAQKVFAHTSKYDEMISTYLYHTIFKLSYPSTV